MTAVVRALIVDDLIRDEGIRLKPYMDSVGKITIGCGRNLSDKGISHAEAMALLDHDLEETVRDLDQSFPWFVALDPVRQRVLANLRFNLGPSRFRTFKRMLMAISQQDYIKAANAMRDSLWAQQVKGRAIRLIAMMRTGNEHALA